eukprot:scaffold55567_cov28-Tisochrysis_lutea.AAC.11
MEVGRLCSPPARPPPSVATPLARASSLASSTVAMSCRRERASHASSLVQRASSRLAPAASRVPCTSSPRNMMASVRLSEDPCQQAWATAGRRAVRDEEWPSKSQGARHAKKKRRK